MEALVHNLVPYVEKVSYGLLILVLGASFIARLTPTPKDDKIVSTVSRFILKAVRFLPTIGINPNTKSLEKSLSDLKEDNGDSKGN